ncbi:hypothetical protein J2X01_002869 [Arthrobacter ginsengisoli]|uniref:DUF4357 domain-containing protein n=1 Tax=Arthrobacter ginsengisoli TaxID=1356565 RepID=A0ABU1UEF8_9MICC|nr:GIY-YIG nuclease family protein [Arthrobacter ginsengisoli]MDR7083574.1 hypothetical protein [Arthrobacter ginsengisoli]
MNLRPQTIQIFLPQGDPSGIRQAEITTRTVRVFEIPRPLLAEFTKMPEARQVGLYFLFGPSDEEAPRCYIGQTQNVGTRLAQHASGKEFWERALVAVSLTNTWTSTHVAYLEWLSIQRATAAARFALENGNSASNPHTPVPLEWECQEYMETVSMLLATLGYPVHQELQSVPRAAVGMQHEELILRERGCNATAYANASGLVVRRGSRGNAVPAPSAEPGLIKRRESLLAQGIATIEGAQIVFQQDHQFNSPSGAAAAVVGGSVNGRTAWKTVDGRTFDALERDRLAPAAIQGDLYGTAQGNDM